MYAGINVLTKLMYFQQILYLLGVNKYYGYGYGYNTCFSFSVLLLNKMIHRMTKKTPSTINQSFRLDMKHIWLK